MLASALAILLAAVAGTPAKLPLRSCVVQSVAARCGTLVVPENRDTGSGRTIALRVVVVPARRKPARADAFTYLAGGPGGAATATTSIVVGIWGGIHEHHDILLVDQRGTGRSHALECPEPTQPADGEDALQRFMSACFSSLDGDPTQYGSAAAADDLDAVRAALGYRQLDVYGVSYGATLAQVYLARHPRAVRTMVLDGGTLLDIPFFSRFAPNGQRALDQVASRCAAVPACARAFPNWPAQLQTLIAAWNAHPQALTRTTTLGGDGLAGVIQSMTLNATSAASIPLVVARAAAGDYAPLAPYAVGGGPMLSIMYWSIWCNERWVGLDAAGPWGTYLDGSAAAALANSRSVCTYFPKHEEPASNVKRVSSKTPLLALVGGADPQDPIGNLEGLRDAMPNSRVVVVPSQGHGVGHVRLPAGCGRALRRPCQRGQARRALRAADHAAPVRGPVGAAAGSPGRRPSWLRRRRPPGRARAVRARPAGSSSPTRCRTTRPPSPGSRRRPS